MTLLIDASTGTVLTAETCYLLFDNSLSDAEWEDLDSSSDSECSAIARERGRSLLLDSSALDAIASTLSGSQWTVDMLDALADIVRSTGRTIDDY